MRSSFDALYDETRQLGLLEPERAEPEARARTHPVLTLLSAALFLGPLVALFLL